MQRASRLWTGIGPALCIAALVRAGFFLYGLYQDAHYKVKYTDIDYMVFNDAARFVYANGTPYDRDTYRYTPLLSWLMVINQSLGWFHAGKLIFVASDLCTGWLIWKLLRSCAVDSKKATIYSLWWLWNPMVITISTRGNAESIMTALTLFVFWLLHSKQYLLAGWIYGLAIHFKIYPIIYSLPMAIYIYHQSGHRIFNLFKIGVATTSILVSLGLLMYQIYGFEFLDQTYLYHIYRIDHRHNFSIWNMLLYLDSARDSFSLTSKLAFIPQLVAITSISWLQWGSSDTLTLLHVVFVQTFAFVTYNKVCTSQYFTWYLVLLPFYLIKSHLSRVRLLFMATLWMLTQGLWLLQGYLLEFEGHNVFFPGLFAASCGFFLGNIWILGQFIDDLRTSYYELLAKKLS